MKTTKRALFSSVVALILCFSMLVSTTFAWFTDEVTSANNVIIAGNLDIKLEYWDGDSWEDVQGKSDILTNELWEPGVVEVAYLRVTNAGTLALKYQLGVNIVSETEGTNVAGETFKLSDYIMFYADEGVNGETNPYDDRNEAILAAVDSTPISKGYTKAASLEAGAAPVYLALIVGMNPSVGNEANYKTGTTAPRINLGINIFATQCAYEESDSFGSDYDKPSPWAGYVDTAWYDNAPDEAEYVLTAAEELAGLAQLVNAGNSFEGKIIKLGANIDLNNLPWTPIGIDLTKRFSATFDGNGYTISNLNVEGVKNVGFIGYAAYGGNVQNVTIKNAFVQGNDYAGAIMGRGYTDITNCHVENAIIVVNPYLQDGIYDGGAKAGGVIGQILEGAGNTVTGCSVNNVKVYGFRDIGGVVGMVHNNNSCSNNTASNVTLGYVLCEQITADVNENAGAIYGRVQASATVTPARDSEENQNFTLEYVASSANELQIALDKAVDGNMIYLRADIEGSVVVTNNNVTIDGMGHTMKGAINLYGADNVTLKNITFDAAGATKDSKGSFYANIMFRNDKKSSRNVTIDGCKFNGTFEQYSSYACIYTYDQGASSGPVANVTITNCEFNALAYASIKLDYAGQGNITVTNNQFNRFYAYAVNPGTSNSSNLIFEGNTVVFTSATHPSGAAVMSASRNGTHQITFKVTGNTFTSNVADAEFNPGILMVRSGANYYTAANFAYEFSGNTFAGEFAGLTEATCNSSLPA